MPNYKLRTVRPKAPWGAVIPAVISGISSIAGMISSSKAAKRQMDATEQQMALQRSQLDAQRLGSEAQAYNQIFSNLTDYDTVDRYAYKFGGKSRLRNVPVIVQAGGTAQKDIDKSGKIIDEFYGATHEQPNEVGGTGIYANIGGKDIEVENEVGAKQGDDYVIISDRLPAGNGKSLAQAVKDKDITFNQAERMQNKIKRLRTTSPVGKNMSRPRADLGATWKPIDFGLLGVQSILPFFARKNSNRYYDKMVDMYGDFDKYLDSNANLAVPGYVPMNINSRDWAQHAAVERAKSNAILSGGRNTASSNVFRNNMQEINTNALEEQNKIFDTENQRNLQARIANNEQRNNFNASIAKMLADYRLGHLGFKAQLFADKLGMYQRRDNDTTDLIRNLSDAAYNFFNAGSIRNRQNMEDMLAMARAQGDTLDRLDTMLGRKSPKYLRDYVSKQRRLKYTTPINTSTYNYNFDINEYLKKNNGVLGRGIKS